MGHGDSHATNVVKMKEEQYLAAQVNHNMAPPVQGHILDSCQLWQATVVVWSRQLGAAERDYPQCLTYCTSQQVIEQQGMNAQSGSMVVKQSWSVAWHTHLRVPLATC